MLKETGSINFELIECSGDRRTPGVVHIDSLQFKLRLAFLLLLN